MTNLSCDLCYHIGAVEEFFPVSDMLFYYTCKNKGYEYHEKLLSTDKRYICIGCIETLKRMN